MNKQRWKTYLLWMALAEGVGAAAGWLTRQGVESYQATVRQPPLSPPGWVFAVIWPILYALMGVGAARVALSDRGETRSRGLRLWLLQLGANFLWPIVFFNGRLYGLALVWLAALWALIWWMTRTFREVEPWAARLQLPYLLWTAFALYLNLGVWALNR